MLAQLEARPAVRSPGIKGGLRSTPLSTPVHPSSAVTLEGRVEPGSHPTFYAHSRWVVRYFLLLFSDNVTFQTEFAMHILQLHNVQCEIK